MKNAKNITFAQIQALWNACEALGMKWFGRYHDESCWHKLIADDALDGARRRRQEWNEIENELHNSLRVNLEYRASMNKELRELQDIDLWEEEGLTPEQSARMSELQEKIKTTKVEDLRIKAVLVEYFE